MTAPYWQGDGITLYLGDCRVVLAELPDDSVDAVVTDPPYGLEFMGREWDRFSGTVADRDFKGFVLSQQRTRNVKCPDCGKWAYDHPGRLCECGGIRRAQESAYQAWCEQWAAECLRVAKPGAYLLAFGGTRTYHRLACAVEDAGWEIRDSLHWIYGSGFPKGKACLKPAHEPVVLARKPARGMVPLNIDGCRVGTDTSRGDRYNGKAPGGSHGNGLTGGLRTEPWDVPAGRWPPNVLLTHAAECNGECAPGCPVAEMDGQSGNRPGFASQYDRSAYVDGNTVYGKGVGNIQPGFRQGFGDSGGASRFFPCFRYQAKAPTSERPRLPDGTTHPTVKPLTLMRWLARLITPPGGTVLDPFAGTGTTGEACTLEGFRCVLIEREAPYCEMAARRLAQGILAVS